MSPLKVNDYYRFLIVSATNALFFIVLLTLLMFFIEIAFELNDGGSLKLFLTSEFIVSFILHELMITFYFVVFLLVFLIRLLIIKLENNSNRPK
ncbi:MAG TPA: hypothetical protein DEO86_04945 [Colwellia sp.]|nr:hypothetical protein [Colwellia sp.]